MWKRKKHRRRSNREERERLARKNRDATQEQRESWARNEEQRLHRQWEAEQDKHNEQ